MSDSGWNQAGRIARLEIARLQRLATDSVIEVPRVSLSPAETERLIERLQRHISESRR